jgi:hypothetical protein
MTANLRRTLYQITMRDREILRTLRRLKFATTGELGAYLFASTDRTRSRLGKLAGTFGLVRRHGRGVDKAVGYWAWRLTHKGIDALCASFPDEPVPEGLATRLAKASVNHEIAHREEVSRVYFGLLCDDTPMPPGGNTASTDARMADLRARAFQFWWEPEGDVLLPAKDEHNGPQKLADNPDARPNDPKADQGDNVTGDTDSELKPHVTVTSRYRSARVFVELDYSSKSADETRKRLRRYRAFFEDGYANTFPDRKKPHLLFVALCNGRHQNLFRYARAELGDVVSWHVLRQGDTTAWLEEVLFDNAQMGTPPEGGPQGPPGDLDAHKVPHAA